MTIARLGRRSLIASAAAGCFASLTAEAFAQVRASAGLTGRPVLTADALNRMIPAPGDPRHATFLREAASDVRGFVLRNFTLTDQQRLELASISPGEIGALQEALRRAADENTPVRVAIRAPSSSSSQREDAEERAREAQEEIKELQAELEEAQRDRDRKDVSVFFGNDPEVHLRIAGPDRDPVNAPAQQPSPSDSQPIRR